MTTRDDVLARIRRNQPAPVVLPPVPTFDGAEVPLLDGFKAGVERMGGKVLEAPGGKGLEALVRSLHPSAKVVCSAVPEVKGTRRLDPGARLPSSTTWMWAWCARSRRGRDGSVWLTEAQFGVSALGFLSQHLVVLLDPALIVGNLHDAYRQRGQFGASYGVQMRSGALKLPRVVERRPASAPTTAPLPVSTPLFPYLYATLGSQSTSGLKKYTSATVSRIIATNGTMPL